MADIFNLSIHYLTDVHFHQIIPLLIALGVGWFVWYFFFRPFDLFMDFTENGFDSVKNRKGSNKRAMINELRHRRKIGELPPPYPNGWFAVLETDLLPLKGVKEVNVLGHNLVAWRGETGRAYVADAYCPHLGAHLGVGGKVGKECIRCPFHDWAFSGETGQLESIPYTDAEISCGVEKKAKLKMWEVEELYGFVFIWHHADGHPPTWSLPKIDCLENSARWKYRGRSELRVTCHIQEIPENGADISHFKAVHSTPALKHGMDLEENWTILKHVWKANWEPNEELGRKHEATATISHAFSFFNDTFRLFSVTVSARQVGPGLVLIDFETPLGNVLLVQTLTPLEPLLQRFTHRLYSPSNPLFHPLGLALLHSEAVQIARDIRIWNRKMFLKRPILIKEDALIIKFRRWFAQFYSDGSCGKLGNESGIQSYLSNGNSPFNIAF